LNGALEVCSNDRDRNICSAARRDGLIEAEVIADYGDVVVLDLICFACERL